MQPGGGAVRPRRSKATESKLLIAIVARASRGERDCEGTEGRGTGLPSRAFASRLAVKLDLPLYAIGRRVNDANNEITVVRKPAWRLHPCSG